MTKKYKKREKFIKKEEKKRFEFKPIYAIVLLIVGGVAYFMFFGSGAEKAEFVPDTLPHAPPSTGNLPSSSEGNTNSTSKADPPKADPNSIHIPISKINDGKAHYYKHQSLTGKVIRFFVLKSSDGVFRAAFDACDVCFEAKKGYRQEGDYMVCNNCGMKFESAKINEISGGCNPSPLERKVEGDNIIIKKSDIEKGAKYF